MSVYSELGKPYKFSCSLAHLFFFTSSLFWLGKLGEDMVSGAEINLMVFPTICMRRQCTALLPFLYSYSLGTVLRDWGVSLFILIRVKLQTQKNMGHANILM